MCETVFVENVEENPVLGRILRKGKSAQVRTIDCVA